jgi:hypothetical protein
VVRKVFFHYDPMGGAVHIVADYSRAATKIPWAIPSLVICMLMVVAGSVTNVFGGPGPFDLTLDYVRGAIATSTLAVLIWTLVRIIQLAIAKSPTPAVTLWTELQPKLPLLILPAVVAPIFLASFTATKSGIITLVGFKFDRLFAEIDYAVFGVDPWQISHAAFGRIETGVIQAFYVPIWVAVLLYSQALIPLFARKKMIGKFFTATLSTWFLGGFVIAYLLPTAGPIFAHLADAELGSRFLPLQEKLGELLAKDAPFRRGPEYLLEGTQSPTAYYGGGISAMPSMHVAVAVLYMLAARGTWLLVPSCIFAAVIFVGSVHSGYHYAVDGVVAALIALLCWRGAERLHNGAPAVGESSHVPAADCT